MGDEKESSHSGHLRMNWSKLFLSHSVSGEDRVSFAGMIDRTVMVVYHRVQPTDLVYRAFLFDKEHCVLLLQTQGSGLNSDDWEDPM